MGGVNLSLHQEFVDGVAAQVFIEAGINSLGFSEGSTTSPLTCGYIWQLLSLAKGDYIETGTRYGGSALIAASLADSVVTIDPAYEAEFAAVMSMAKPDFVKKITRIGSRSDKIKKLPKRNYTVGFIDGSHAYDDVMADFHLFDKRVSRFLIFDDVDLPGVRKAVEGIMLTQDVWKLVVFSYPTTAVLAKNFDPNLKLGIF